MSEIGLALRWKKRRKIEKTRRGGYYRSSGIYSLSPYTLEEVVARNYLITERPDAILNIIDGTNLERNLYLTTQITELGIPVVVAINMMEHLVKLQRTYPIRPNTGYGYQGFPFLRRMALQPRIALRG